MGFYLRISSQTQLIMSADICWSIVRKNSCFLVKSHTQGITLTREANNLTARNAFNHNGFVNKKAVGVEAGEDGKGLVLTMKNKKGGNMTTKVSGGSRRAIKVIKNALGSASYRLDLCKQAERRASAILKSQKSTGVAKKHRSRRKKL